MALHNYHATIPWHELKAFLADRLAQTQEAYMNEDDPRVSDRLKGKARELKALLNLPDALTSLAEAKEAEKSAS